MTRPIEYSILSASVTGPGHRRADLPNQDACLSFSKDGRTGIVLSDGLGSCEKSDKGSKAVCCAVVSAMEQETTAERFDTTRFLKNVKSAYCDFIDADDFLDYQATCLWCLCPDDARLHAGMLGDGMLAVVKRDGTIVRLSDNKTDGFSNVVLPLSPRTEISQWQTMSIPEDEVDYVMLCSDGVSDDLVDADGFVRAFFAEYGERVAAENEIATMLENWPVPLHSDDKTIICMVRRRA